MHVLLLISLCFCTLAAYLLLPVKQRPFCCVHCWQLPSWTACLCCCCHPLRPPHQHPLLVITHRQLVHVELVLAVTQQSFVNRNVWLLPSQVVHLLYLLLPIHQTLPLRDGKAGNHQNQQSCLVIDALFVSSLEGLHPHRLVVRTKYRRSISSSR